MIAELKTELKDFFLQSPQGQSEQIECWNNGILIVENKNHCSPIIPLFHYSIIPFFLSLRSLGLGKAGEDICILGIIRFGE
jgi:hypothetical protein